MIVRELVTRPLVIVVEVTGERREITILSNGSDEDLNVVEGNDG